MADPEPPVPPSTGAPEPVTPVTSDEEIAERLIQSVHPTSRPRRRRTPPSGSSSKEVLRRWVGGDEQAIDAWLRSEPVTLDAAGAAVAEIVAPGITAETHGAEVALVPPEPPTPSEALAERERTVLKWLTDLLDRVRSEAFDPSTLLDDLQQLNRDLHEERTQRQRLEAEVERIKRGSISVIKYVRGREANAREEAIRALRAEIDELKLRSMRPVGDAPPMAPDGAEELGRHDAAAAERESELRKRIVQLESERDAAREESASRGTMLEGESAVMPAAVSARLKELEAREKELSGRESALRVRFEEIRIATDDRGRLQELLKIKEKQLGEWEVQLRTLKQEVEREASGLEQVRREAAELGPAQSAMKRLQELRDELAKREDDLRSRETLLRQRSQELEGQLAEAIASGAVGPAAAPVGPPEASAASASDDARISTGVRRLDDLLFGGLPKGSQVLLNGPAHTGKELLARLFVADGLRRGVPAIFIVTDKTYQQVREEMTGLLPSYPELERREMVRYVDLYSRSLGTSKMEAGVRFLQTSDKAVLEQVTNAVNAYASELKAIAPSYRLVFESVSTVTAYLDTTATFRFLQPFTGRRKLEGATALYNLETGMHSESDLETLEHMVDGSINLKIEQLKTFLSVRGLTDVQSRAWVGYTFTKRAFSLGSFSLDHIR